MPPSRGGGGEGNTAPEEEAEAAAATAEQAPSSKREGQTLSQASSPSTISARRPLGSRPLTLTPPPPVATLLRALASAGAILVDDDLRFRAAHALRAGESELLFFPFHDGSLRGKGSFFFFARPSLSLKPQTRLKKKLQASEPPPPRPRRGPERSSCGPSRTPWRPGSRGASPRKGRQRSTYR